MYKRQGYKDALNNIGGIFKKFGQYKKALSFYEKLIKIDPNYKDALNNIGVVFHELGQYEKAMSFYEKAIKIDPNFTRAHFNRGVLLYERGKYENAMEVLKLINFKNSNSYLLSCLFKLDRPSVFQELLNKIIKIKEGNGFDAMIGSSCSRSKLKYGINISNPFCNDPLNYVLKRNLTELCDFNNIFVKTIRNILDKTKNIAMIGLSSSWQRPSYFVAKYLLDRGYKVFPVHPKEAGKKILNQKVYSSILEINEKIDMVNIFIKSSDIDILINDILN